MTKAIEITVDEAISILNEGECIHNMVQSACFLLGANHNRSDVLKALDDADQILLGGPECQALGHPIVVIKDKKSSFYEANMSAFDLLKAKNLNEQHADDDNPQG